MEELLLKYIIKVYYPDNILYLIRLSSRDLSLIREELSPININSKPEEYPPNYTAAKLFSESSGRIELPDNKLYSRRHAFKKLFHIPEESSLPVNFLNKLTLKKKEEIL